MAAAMTRVVVTMTPQEKAELDMKAMSAGPISAAELVRRAVNAYEIGSREEAEELAALLDLFKRTHAETLDQLDRADRKLDETFRHLAELDA